jgi:hypothetical protein
MRRTRIEHILSTLTSDRRADIWYRRSVPVTDIAAFIRSLVGAHEDPVRHCEAECLGGLEINHQFEFRELLYG